MKKSRILISGGYGNGNAGDEALMIVIYEQLVKKLPNAEFYFFSDDPSYSRIRYGFGKFVYSGRFGLFEPGLRGLSSLRWIVQSFLFFLKIDLFVQGGGTVLQDQTHSFFIAFWLFKILIAKIFFKKTIMYGIGVGLITSTFNKFIIRILLNKVNLITVRGQYSFDVLKKLGIKESILMLAADPVFNLSYNIESEIASNLNILIRETGSFKVCFVVRRWYLRHLTSLEQKDWIPKGKEMYDRLIRSYALFADYLIDKHNANIFFLSMSTKEPNDDRMAAKDIVGLIKEKRFCSIIEEELSPKEIKAILSGMDFLLGMRFHSLVFFAEFLKPMIAVGYGMKTYDLMNTLGLEDQMLDVNKLNYEDLEGLFKKVMFKYKDNDFKSLLNHKIQQQSVLALEIPNRLEAVLFNEK